MEGPQGAQSPIVRRVRSSPGLLPPDSGTRETGGSITQGLPSPAVGGMEVWVAHRPFGSWCGGIMHKIPQPLALAAKDAGVCHYLVILRDLDNGQLHSFDFGPVGGDTTLQVSRVHDPTTKQVRLGAQGEIREEMIPELPPGAMLAGSSGWDLEAIRRHNQQQLTTYRLNHNDCRHYVNNLVRTTTGMEGATAQLLKLTFEQRMSSERERWLQRVVGPPTPPAHSAQGEEADTLASMPPCIDSTGSGGMRTRLSVHSASAPALDSLVSSTTPWTTHQHPPDVRQHCATAAATLGALRAPSVSRGRAVDGPSSDAAAAAVPIMVPLLAAMPTWDMGLAPIVALGQWLTDPDHWTTVHAMGQATVASAGVAVGMRAAGLVHVTAHAAKALATAAPAALAGAPAQAAAAAAAVARASALPPLVAPVGAVARALPTVAGLTRRTAMAAAAGVSSSPGVPTPGPLRSAMQALPRLVQALRTHQLQPPAPYAPLVSRSAMQVAKALAQQLRTKAAQVAAPLVAVATSHTRHRQLRLQQLQAGGASQVPSPKGGVADGARDLTPRSRLQLVLKGGLLPLPLRPQRAAAAVQGVLSSSSLPLPAALLTAAAEQLPPAAAAASSNGNRSRKWGRRSPASQQLALLPPATLQAAVQPEGPLAPRRRNLLSLGRQPRQPAGPLQLSWAATTQQQPRSFLRLAMNPLAWIGMGYRRAPSNTSPAGLVAPTTVTVLCPAAVSVPGLFPPTAHPTLAYPTQNRTPRAWLWTRPGRPLPPPVPTSPCQAAPPRLLADVVQPLDTRDTTLDTEGAHAHTLAVRVSPPPAAGMLAWFSRQRRAKSAALQAPLPPAAAPLLLCGPPPAAALQPQTPSSPAEQQLPAAKLPSWSTTARTPPPPVLLHMPSLPAPPPGPRRRFLFRQRAAAAPAAEGANTGDVPRRQRGRAGRSSHGGVWWQQPSAWLVALLAHMQATRSMLPHSAHVLTAYA